MSEAVHRDDREIMILAGRQPREGEHGGRPRHTRKGSHAAHVRKRTGIGDIDIEPRDILRARLEIGSPVEGHHVSLAPTR
jgi:hypothetical protein